METEPVVTVSDTARTKVMNIKSTEPDGADLALWVEISGSTGDEYAYDMYFQPVAEAQPGDVVQGHDDLPVVIPAASVERMRGATLDMSKNLLQPGMVMINPNRPPSARSSPAITPRDPSELTGDVAERVAQVLTEQINPGIAAHGGKAELVAVEEDTAYLRLSGGCQGCGMATVTLSQGIKVAITESVPEISNVVDVTDHSSGSNPYYEAAKK